MSQILIQSQSLCEANQGLQKQQQKQKASSPILSVRDLSFSYRQVPTLQKISFDLNSGHFVCVLGANGAGKTTLFKLLLKQLKAQEGRILYDGTEISELSTRTLAQKVAYIPQIHQLQFSYSVFDMVLMGTSGSFSYLSGPTQEAKLRTQKALERLNLSNYADRMYDRLSGGEQQLVLIARALAQQTPILVMDEPCSALDYGNQMRVLRIIRELADEGYTILLSTHHPEHARLFAHQVMVIHEKKLFAHGPTASTLSADLLQEIYHIEIREDQLLSNGETIFVVEQKSVLN